jgi:class 3 adenylate cyclase
VRVGPWPLCADQSSDKRPVNSSGIARRIQASRSALEGERKQVTVLFADVKGPRMSRSRDPKTGTASWSVSDASML